ncbi:MAG TPA: hypothetical protein VFR06_03820 [Gallionellaceae bacterium]|nr:hypothetical protein [Gallionellaceae bacterium]
MFTSFFLKNADIPAKLFESKSAHGKTSTAETLIQITNCLVRGIHAYGKLILQVNLPGPARNWLQTTPALPLRPFRAPAQFWQNELAAAARSACSAFGIHASLYCLLQYSLTNPRLNFTLKSRLIIVN